MRELIIYRGDSIYNGGYTLPSYGDILGLPTTHFGFNDGLFKTYNGIHEILKIETKQRCKYLITHGEIRKYFSLSFSLSERVALYWMSDKNTLEVQPSYAPDIGERFLFTMKVKIQHLEKLIPCVYRYKYYCSRWECNCKHNANPHQLLLINYARYLMQFKESSELEYVRYNARKTREWLLLPEDVIEIDEQPYNILFKNDSLMVDVYDEQFEF